MLLLTMRYFFGIMGMLNMRSIVVTGEAFQTDSHQAWMAEFYLSNNNINKLYICIFLYFTLTTLECRGTRIPVATSKGFSNTSHNRKTGLINLPVPVVLEYLVPVPVPVPGTTRARCLFSHGT
jgi:hypothetical protein